MNANLRAWAVGGLALALSATLSAPASADIFDAPGGILSNTIEYLDKITPITTNPNISCGLEPTGGSINQHTNAGLVDVTAQDYTEASVVCVNLDRTAPAFRISVFVQVEHLIKQGFTGAGTWAKTSICKSGTTTVTSSNGVASVPLSSVVCVWPALEPIGGGLYRASQYLNTLHRGHVYVTSPSGSFGPKDKPTPTTWFMTG